MNLDITKHRGLDAAEGEGKSSGRRIRAVSLLFDLGEGKGDGGGIPMSGQRIDPGTARVAQSQQLGDLVEGLAGCIVERGAHVAVAPAFSIR